MRRIIDRNLRFAIWMMVAFISPVWGTEVVLAQSSFSSASTGGKVDLRETEFNFGYMPGDAAVSHRYTLYSTGKDSLKIFNIKPGCNCTKAPLEKDVIAPGDSTDIELIFTSAKSGYGGEVRKSATVTCNDNDRGTFQLLFRAKVYGTGDTLSPLVLSASSIDFGPSGKDQEISLKIKNVSDRSVSLTPVSESADHLIVTLPKEAIRPGKVQEIRVKLQPSIPEAEMKKSFTFACDDSAGTRYTVPVSYLKLTAKAPLELPTSIDKRIPAADSSKSGKAAGK